MIVAVYVVPGVNPGIVNACVVLLAVIGYVVPPITIVPVVATSVPNDNVTDDVVVVAVGHDTKTGAVHTGGLAGTENGT